MSLVEKFTKAVDELLPHSRPNEWKIFSYIFAEVHKAQTDVVELSYNDIKKATGIRGANTIVFALQSLEKAGAITVVSGKGQGIKNRYQVTAKFVW